jgi:3-oxoacyl-[acyl-carrier protein] reductase
MGSEGRVAFITEGTGPRCRELCLELAKRGFMIGFAHDDSDEVSDRLCREIESAGSEAVSRRVEKFAAGDLSAAVIETAEKFGGIDVLIHPCMLQPPLDEGGLVLDLDEEDWDDAMNRGARGFFLSCKYALPYLINRPRAGILALSAIPRAPLGASLAVYAANCALRASVEHMSRETTLFGISITYREIRDEPGWLEDLMTAPGIAVA